MRPDDLDFELAKDARSPGAPFLVAAYRLMMEDHTPEEADAVDHVGGALRALGIDPADIDTAVDLEA